MAHILVAEHAASAVQSIRDSLLEEHHSVDTAKTGIEAWGKLAEATFELLILSLEVQDCRGTELLRRVRRSPLLARLPVIVRSREPDEIDRVLAFELGADDFVSAADSLRELTLRVRAVLRRARNGKPRRKKEPIELGDLKFRPGTRELVIGSSHQRLTPVENRLLATLLEEPSRVWRREDLLRRVWTQEELDRRTVDSQVRRLRGKMGPAAHLLETVRGVGYRLRVDRLALGSSQVDHGSAQSPPE